MLNELIDLVDSKSRVLPALLVKGDSPKDRPKDYRRIVSPVHRFVSFHLGG